MICAAPRHRWPCVPCTRAGKRNKMLISSRFNLPSRFTCSAVTRVAFVPMPTEEQQSSSFTSSNNVTMDAGKAAQVEQMPSDELRKSIAANLLITQQQLATMSSLGYGSASVGSSLATPATARGQRDSFCDFLDAHRPRAVDRMSTRLTTTARRDSFDWDALHSKPKNEEQRQSICPTGSGLSSIDSANSSTVDSLQREYR